ncbi:MAG: TolC family protein [Gammaproteobacteria bacterium]
MRIPGAGLAGLLSGLMLASWAANAAELENSALEQADPTLGEFVRSVVDVNPRVRAAHAALAASGAIRTAASQPLYNPELSFLAAEGDTGRVALGFSQTLDWRGGKRKARTAVAESDRLAVESEYHKTRWAVTVELLNGLARHQTESDRDDLAQARHKVMEKFSTLAEERFGVGDLRRVEVDLAELAAMDARMQKATADAALAEARQAVRSLTLSSPAAQWPMRPGSMPELPVSADPDSLVLALPEVVVARRHVESADAVVELRRRQQRPDPTFSLAGGAEDDDALLGLRISMPLFVRNHFGAEVDAAVAEYALAQEMADDVLLRARARFISAAERYELSLGAWKDWRRAKRVNVTRQMEGLQRLWNDGELSTTDYLVQLRTVLDMQEHALELREALWRAWFEWLWAAGKLDAWLGWDAYR